MKQYRFINPDHVSREDARHLLIEQMGYKTLADVPMGFGNEYLMALRRIAEGDFVGEYFPKVQILVRMENRLNAARLKRERGS